MKKHKTISSHNILAYEEPIMQPIAGINEAPNDYKLLKNKGWGIWYASLDFWATAWATWDGTYREVNIGGADWDMQTAYTSYTLLTGLGTMDYKLTKKVSGVTISGNNISVPAWKTCRISCYPNGINHYVRITVTGGSLRYLKGWSLDFTWASWDCAFINASTSDATFVIKYATPASSRPIFWLLIEIF